MLLSHNRLIELIDQGVITANLENVNAASIDITLDNVVMFECRSPKERIINLAKKETIEVITYNMKDSQVFLNPGECLLASSKEVFNLPNNISAEYKLKSSMARNFLEHLNAGWCDAGWNGSKLTLELKNMSQNHTFILEPGMRIGQMIFYEHEAVPDHASYAVKGRYNNQQEVTASKGI